MSIKIIETIPMTVERRRFGLSYIGAKTLLLQDFMNKVSYRISCGSANEADSFYNRTEKELADWLSGYMLVHAGTQSKQNKQKK